MFAKKAIVLTLSVFAASLYGQNAIIRLFDPNYSDFMPLRTDSIIIEDNSSHTNQWLRTIAYEYDTAGRISADREIQIDAIQNTYKEISKQWMYSGNNIFIESEVRDTLNNLLSKEKTSLLNVTATEPDTVINQVWDGSQWRNSSRTFPSATSETVTSKVNQVWNPTASAWENDHAYFYTYLSGKLISVTNKTWQDLDWVTNDEHTYTYDGSNRVVADVWSVLTDTTWAYAGREVKSYAANGHLTASRLYIWDADENTWKIQSAIDLTTEQHQQAGHGDVYLFDAVGAEMRVEKTLITDGDGIYTDQPAEELTQAFSTQDSTWIDSRRKTVAYTPLTADQVYGTLLIERYSPERVEWDPQLSVQAWFTVAPTEPRSQPEVLYTCNIKNPLTRNQTIVLPERAGAERYQLKLFSVDGREVFRETMPGSGVLHFNTNLHPGFYIAQVYEGDQPVCLQKIIIE